MAVAPPVSTTKGGDVYHRTRWGKPVNLALFYNKNNLNKGLEPNTLKGLSKLGGVVDQALAAYGQASDLTGARRPRVAGGLAPARARAAAAAAPAPAPAPAAS
ncbi:hypothetical protein HC256_009986 [Beauveria bassiana]|nr:hypothetical protein HC256_009986 [Beauveria bassiana]